MHELESPLDIYTHDLLGMEKSSWHRVDQPKEESSKPTPLSPKQKYITILLCVGFLCFVALGVWTIQRKTFPTNMMEVNTKVFFSVLIESSEQVFPREANTELFTLTFMENRPLFPTYSNYCIEQEPSWGWGPVFSEITKEQAQNMDRREAIWNSITPPSNWQELIHPERNYIVVHSCLGSSGYYVGW